MPIELRLATARLEDSGLCTVAFDNGLGITVEVNVQEGAQSALRRLCTANGGLLRGFETTHEGDGFIGFVVRFEPFAQAPKCPGCDGRGSFQLFTSALQKCERCAGTGNAASPESAEGP